MGKIKCEKPNALVLGGKIMMIQTSGFQNTDVQPYLQVGSMHPEKQKEMNWLVHRHKIYCGSRNNEHKYELRMPCDGDYERAFFFYPTENEHYDFIFKLLAQAPASDHCAERFLRNVCMCTAIQTEIALEGEENPVKTLIVVHFAENN